MLRFNIDLVRVRTGEGEFVRYTDHKAEVEAMLGVCKTYQKDRDEANAAHDILVVQNKTLAGALEEMKREHTKVFDELMRVRAEQRQDAARQHSEAAPGHGAAAY